MTLSNSPPRQAAGAHLDDGIHDPSCIVHRVASHFPCPGHVGKARELDGQSYLLTHVLTYLLLTTYYLLLTTCY